MRVASFFSAIVTCLLIAVIAGLCLSTASLAHDDHLPQYNTIQEQLTNGWNTFNLLNIASQVLLPEGMAVNLGFYRENPKKAAENHHRCCQDSLQIPAL